MAETTKRVQEVYTGKRRVYFTKTGGKYTVLQLYDEITSDKYGRVSEHNFFVLYEGKRYGWYQTANRIYMSSKADKKPGLSSPMTRW